MIPKPTTITPGQCWRHVGDGRLYTVAGLSESCGLRWADFAGDLGCCTVQHMIESPNWEYVTAHPSHTE